MLRLYQMYFNISGVCPVLLLIRLGLNNKEVKK